MGCHVCGGGVMGVWNIIAGAPLWVWPLFLVLFGIGLHASRVRSSPVIGYYMLPLMGLLSLNGLSSSTMPNLAMVFFCSAYVAGALFFFEFQGGLIVGKSGGRVQLRGDWLMMAAIMVIFWLNFAQGYVASQMPALEMTTTYVVITSALMGAVSGQFAGRSLRVIFWRSTP